MGGACSMFGGEKKCILGFDWGNLRERRHLEDRGIDGRIIFYMDLQEMGCGGMEWIDLVLDKDRWQTLVNAVMNL
jgi:hypothetical protein